MMEDKSNIVTGTVGTKKGRILMQLAAATSGMLFAADHKTREAIPALTGSQMTQMRRIQNARFTKQATVAGYRKAARMPERLRAGFYVHGQHAKKEAAV
jgi:hypothetical protein